MEKALMQREGYAALDEYTSADLLAVAAAREVREEEVVFAGTGLPMLAIMLAQVSGTSCKVIYEAGTIESQSRSLPSSVGDPRCVTGCSIASGLLDVFDQLQRGRIDLAFLGGAEIDQYGNVNTTVIGDYLHPDVRFPGSGGNSDINSLSKRTVFIMLQEKRRFKEQVDYITSPGWRVRHWPSGEWVHRRRAYGQKFAGGPTAVITNMAVYRFDEESGRMYVDTIHPGVAKDMLQENAGFPLDFSRCRGETVPPTYEELDILYQVVDPEGVFLAKKS
ncbi:CoA-transferase subunit beta [Bacillus thermotolerans]|uniref:3-oxoadipate CoA-transferase subunit B n=1 Tax=Bacillus thermotolerans TaxID=1221996 RepID=A0A0F5HM50_BACTR|nr:CoA-transferase [Bacillus thermotolerans]KKB33470.1 3-oxoadipate CoA-transferase subunit B [Bacillus thermotolerans]KKB34366.1 3-oxoadipate CoA-transferase subunit B [Bacillus thermotolerans]KKB41089.1 3-oxoadipate CoA-transferase subunit B [Bacillus thermotolerans]